MNKFKIQISLWWLIQLCGLLVLGMRHLGHILVFMLLLMSIVGFVFGGRKIALIASLGLAAYSALTLLLSLLLLYTYDFGSWLLCIAALAIAASNFILSFWTINKLRGSRD